MYHAALKGFDGTVYEGRWGSIAFCIGSILEIEKILRLGVHGVYFRSVNSMDLSKVVATNSKQLSKYKIICGMSQDRRESFRFIHL